MPLKETELEGFKRLGQRWVSDDVYNIVYLVLGQGGYDMVKLGGVAGDIF